MQEAVSAALHAGCDADCGHDYQQGIPPMVANGTIDMQLVDKAVLRVLTNRMMLGELEVLRDFTRFLWKSRLKFARACHHLPSSSRRHSRLLEQDGTPKNPWRNLTLEALLPPHVALARRAAREAVVLLRNRAVGGRPLLPVVGAALKSVAVVGPSADSASAYIGDCATRFPPPPYPQAASAVVETRRLLTSSTWLCRCPATGVLHHGVLRGQGGPAWRDDRHGSWLQGHQLRRQLAVHTGRCRRG